MVKDLKENIRNLEKSKAQKQRLRALNGRF